MEAPHEEVQRLREQIAALAAENVGLLTAAAAAAAASAHAGTLSPARDDIIVTDKRPSTFAQYEALLPECVAAFPDVNGRNLLSAPLHARTTIAR